MIVINFIRVQHFCPNVTHAPADTDMWLSSEEKQLNQLGGLFDHTAHSMSTWCISVAFPSHTSLKLYNCKEAPAVYLMSL